jgi:glycosyltransferase involved in cell wall biosynthesis
VVYAGRGLAAEFLERQGMAVVVPPQDPEAFAGAIRALLENPERMRDMAIRGRRYVEEHYCREVLLERLLEAVNARLNSRKSVS